MCRPVKSRLELHCLSDFGPYELTAKAHTAIHEYIGAHNKKIIGAPWEVYVTDPGLEKDTAKWETDVYYPVE